MLVLFPERRPSSLSRLGTKEYSEGTATVTMCYGDGIPSPLSGGLTWSCSGAPSGGFTKLRLTSVTTRSYSQTLNTAYDELGRITASQQTTNGTPYAFSGLGYAPTTSLTNMTMPSGRALTFSYDSSARPNGISGVLSGTATTYGTVPMTAGFWASGAIQTLNLAGTTSGFQQTSMYDSRLRPTSLGLTASGGTETLTYTWLANSNLQVEKIANTQNTASPLTQTFAYDTVNRVISAVETGGSSEWTQYRTGTAPADLFSQPCAATDNVT